MKTTLVRVTIETGRLHQIRLHFAQPGYPVVMDDEHGDFAFNKRFPNAMASSVIFSTPLV